MNSNPNESAELVRDLLQEVLAPVCTARKLDQVAKLDSAQVACDAWRDFHTENPQLETNTWWCSPEVIGALDSVIVASLGDAADEAATSLETEPGVDFDALTMAAMEALLGDWLSVWHRQLCVIGPLAAEMVLLRLRGFGNRAISEGLETGLRLVNRMVDDIRVERVESRKIRNKEGV